MKICGNCNEVGTFDNYVLAFADQNRASPLDPQYAALSRCYECGVAYGTGEYEDLQDDPGPELES